MPALLMLLMPLLVACYADYVRSPAAPFAAPCRQRFVFHYAPILLRCCRHADA